MKGIDPMRPQCSGQRAKEGAKPPSNPARLPPGLQHWRKSEEEVPLGPTPSAWLLCKEGMKVRAGNPSKSDSIYLLGSAR